jgi:acyl-coenzyme A synthetase/AMP-(fatty) acid ligase
VSMKMQPYCLEPIRDCLHSSGDCSRRFLWGDSASIPISDMLSGACVAAQLADLSGRSVLIAAKDQFAAASVLMRLEGIANRIVICPPEISSKQLPFVIATGGVDTVWSDGEISVIKPPQAGALVNGPTEWVLLTSGSTGAPKMIVHTLATLTAPIEISPNPGGVVWGTFYDIRRYGGLQIFLRAILSDASLVLSSAAEPVSDHLARLGSHGVTHLSGTPSHQRRVLMSPQARAISPRYIRLSGEIADSAILNSLQSFYPNAAISHAFASTEAGVAFEVNDGREGFSASLLGARGDVEMKVRNHSLQIRSNRAALRYLGREHGKIADEEGFVDTGDIVELRGDRYYFLGRRNGVINVGGLKVYPEEVEAVINRHPAVRMSRVRPRKNPILGALVSADIVPKDATGHECDLSAEVLEICRRSLAPHKIPATIRCVTTLELSPGGKLVRSHA